MTGVWKRHCKGMTGIWMVHDMTGIWMGHDRDMDGT